jgi:hypothetical protein
MCRPVQIYLASQLGDEGNTPLFAELNCGKAVVFVLDDRRGDIDQTPKRGVGAQRSIQCRVAMPTIIGPSTSPDRETNEA